LYDIFYGKYDIDISNFVFNYWTDLPCHSLKFDFECREWK